MAEGFTGDALEIVCPANTAYIRHIRINGVDCGDVQGVSKIMFEVVPDRIPKLVIERLSIGGVQKSVVTIHEEKS